MRSMRENPDTSAESGDKKMILLAVKRSTERRQKQTDRQKETKTFCRSQEIKKNHPFLKD